MAARRRKGGCCQKPWLVLLFVLFAVALLSGGYLAVRMQELDRLHAPLVVTAVAPQIKGVRPVGGHATQQGQKQSLQAGRLSASLQLVPGRPPLITGLQWRAANAADEQGPTWHTAFQNGQPLHLEVGGAYCVVRAGSHLDCGGFEAELAVTAVDVGPEGAALRWRLRSAVAPKSVHLSMMLPGAAVEGAVDGSPITSRHRPALSTFTAVCKASSSFPDKGPHRVADGDGESEWFAGKGEEEAWITLDLGAERNIQKIDFQWWAASFADEWKLESRGDDSTSWVERVNSDTAPRRTENFNPWVHLSGWSGTARYLRLSMSKGHKDPWGFGVNFGLRSFDVVGWDEAEAAGPGEIWGGTSPGSPGLWLALEHPRARCKVQTVRQEALPKWRTVECELRLPQKGKAGLDITGSMGIFEDGEHSQLRRVFHGYLQAVRGRPFGQVLHYNSWYDLASERMSHSHLMTEGSCSERIKAFNANLSANGGPPLDAFLLDDGWDDWDTLWEVDGKRFPKGFAGLQQEAQRWKTRLGVWMSPFGGYGKAGSKRLQYGSRHSFERSSRGGFSLAGEKYFATFQGVVQKRIREGFGLFKFDGLGGGLGQSGGEPYMEDFEAVLTLIQGIRATSNVSGHGDVWVSLTIGTWPSPFWLLWGDSIWRDGPDVGQEGGGPQRERWLTFRDAALRRASKRGLLFPMTAFMQHGVVWSHSRETDEMWPASKDDVLDFCKEAVTFFLSGTGLQELYLQLELMTPRHWRALAAASSYARRNAALLRDAHAIGGYPVTGQLYGAASFVAASEAAQGLLWWRNPTDRAQQLSFRLGDVLELPQRLLSPSGRRCWQLRPLLLPGAECLGEAPAGHAQKLWGPQEEISLELEAFAVHAWEASMTSCGQ